MKYRVKRTGEIVDVISYYPAVGYCTCLNADGTKVDRPFNKDEDLEEYNEPNWELRRYEAAKCILRAMIEARMESIDIFIGDDEKRQRLNLAQAAVWYADALICNLKNGIQ